VGQHTEQDCYGDNRDGLVGDRPETLQGEQCEDE
jgi:hypothetical protein